VRLPPTARLFQRRINNENQAFAHSSILKMLTAAVTRAGLVDPVDGQPLHYTPHDFRRMFITDAILNGLPPHIAQVIAGHQDINVTLGYKAVYPDEAIQAHLAFLARRRSLRPSEEYRVPTDEEWSEFLGHFERRTVSIGTCARAFSTPCIHEHACVRCSMLWPDPNQRHRLVDIRDNLLDRIAEAEREGWLNVANLALSPSGTGKSLVDDPYSHGDRHVSRIHCHKCRDVIPKPRCQRLLKIIAPRVGKHRGSEILEHARHEVDDRVEVFRDSASDDRCGHGQHHRVDRSLPPS
jgi:hypothetical protein